MWYVFIITANTEKFITLNVKTTPFSSMLVLCCQCTKTFHCMLCCIVNYHYSNLPTAQVLYILICNIVSMINMS